MARRRGARHPTLVPAAVRRSLEAGCESSNHMEQIAMDMGKLLGSQFPSLAARADEVRDKGLVTRMRAGGRILHQELGLEAMVTGQTWRSDTTRGWAAMAIGQAAGLSLSERLQLLRPFANDPHFAVREWAWLSLRPHIAEDVETAVMALRRWTSEDSDRLRRFSTEVTRPRGVWCAHLPALKRKPAIGLPLLEALRGDPSRYVQNSVANWLNDASKSCPNWVHEVCERWLKETDAPSTRRVCRRACRSLTRDLWPEPADL